MTTNLTDICTSYLRKILKNETVNFSIFELYDCIKYHLIEFGDEYELDETHSIYKLLDCWNIRSFKKPLIYKKEIFECIFALYKNIDIHSELIYIYYNYLNENKNAITDDEEFLDISMFLVEWIIKNILTTEKILIICNNNDKIHTYKNINVLLNKLIRIHPLLVERLIEENKFETVINHCSLATIKYLLDTYNNFDEFTYEYLINLKNLKEIEINTLLHKKFVNINCVYSEIISDDQLDIMQFGF